MNRPPLARRTLALIAVVVPLLALFAWVALRSGPMAPVEVTVATVSVQSLEPALFGIGTVEARFTHRIGPTFAARLQWLDVDVGDRVSAGQVLGGMDPVDLDERLRALASGSRRAEAIEREAAARHTYAESQLRRYEAVFARGLTSEEVVTAKRQDLAVAVAALAAAREEAARARSDREALVAERSSLQLIAPVDGLVAMRAVDPGSTVVAGQTVLEVIDPESLWLNVRFDQLSMAGLAAGLPARIELRSRGGEALAGLVLRVEPMADAVTEEALAKVIFDQPPEPLPSIGELVEVTVALPALPPVPVVPNPAVRHDGSQSGVWQIENGELHFQPVRLGAIDLDGRVQVLEGLEEGAEVVLYSERALSARSRIHVVDNLAGMAR